MRAALLTTIALGAVAFALTPTRARADGPYEGQWTPGASHTDVAIHSWGADCGPRPQSTTAGGGGAVNITQDGDNLTFHGRRTTRTNACWSENRAVRLVATSVQGGTWRTVCRTSPDDSRGETGTYTIRAAGGDALSYTDVSDYDWQLAGSHCTATVTTTQTFTRVRTAVVTPPTPPTPPDPHPTCHAGAPARLSLRPSTVTVQPGERTCLRARVVDAAGCAIPGADVRWDLERPTGLGGELADGCFRAAETAAEAEGTFRITATSGPLHDTATVVVQTENLSDLIARRGEGGGVASTDGNATASDAAGVAAHTASTSHPSLVGPLIGGGVALLLVLVVVVVLVAGRSKASPAPQRASVSTPGAPLQPQPGAPVQPLGAAVHPPQQPQAAMAVASARSPSPRAVCPSCHQEFAGDVAFCPNDGARLVTGAAAPSTAAPAQGMICPVCRRGYPPETKFCPNDSEEVVPYAMFLAGQRAKEQAGPSKICPQCGSRYGTGTTFCGKDGSELVLVN